ncbi:acyl-CoA dehydrogenase family protein [Streptomyces coelicoflavus]|uniref:acyl-CoA dehydrogenase family protein n=1 Tax=Streptomyces coelicoflavus TaxID=285562 RepID=UPI0024AE534F|nr:acyl-CoA dehydrogenase family protein [Streptomyces coelicoflavus]MDI6520309.1 acyl-CoA dehydrogenase family protein [Streptomyces coelicoflavus]
MGGYHSPWADEETHQVGRLARSFFERSVLPHTQRFGAQHRVDRETWTEAGRLGLLCPSIPQEYGGGGGTFAHEAAVLWEQGRLADDCLPYAIHSTVVPHYVERYGSEEQKRRWLPALAAGTLVGAIAMSEPSGGSDLKRVRTVARREGDHYVISGAKSFVTNGSMAGLVLVVARTGEQGAHGLSIIGVEKEHATGLSHGGPLKKIGQHGQDTRELFLDDVRVPVENLIGESEGRGFAQLMAQLPQERLAIAVGAVAQAEYAVELAVRYAKERTAFGGPLWDLQNTRLTLADCATEVRIARVFLDHCVARHLSGGLDAATASQSKYHSTDLLSSVADRCLQVFGGYGYVLEYPIARIYAGARVQRIYGGANEVMRELVARSM